MKIIIGGDFFPGGSNDKAAINSPSNLWGDILPLFKAADLRIVNLECALTTATVKLSKTGPNLKAHPGTINALKYAKVNFVTLANNHIYDYGHEGLKDTLDICSNNGISTVGANLSLSSAREPLFVDNSDQSLAIVNFSENEWCNANPSSGGANPYDLIDCARQIREARAHADIVLVIIHGGHEHFHYPSPRMVKEYRFFAEQGASAIVCHHTHCIGGFEVHNGTPIFYSLGNLFFPSETNFAGWYQGYLLNLSFDVANKPSWQMIPYSQMRPKFGIWQLRGEGKNEFDRAISDINQAIADQELLQSHWQRFAIERSSQYLTSTTIPWRMVARILSRLRLTPPLAKTMDLKPLHNLIRCESHRELLLTILNDTYLCKTK